SLEHGPCVLVPRVCLLGPPFSSYHHRHQPFILSPRFAHRTPQPHRPFVSSKTSSFHALLSAMMHDALASVRHISLSRTGSLCPCVSLSSTLCHHLPLLIGEYTSYPLSCQNSHLTRSSLAQSQMTSVAGAPPAEPRNGQIIEVLLTKHPPTNHTPLMALND
ncbi:hypothetical protein EDB86DRAFT_2948591, partial [Lactarius hatsudake]